MAFKMKYKNSSFPFKSEEKSKKKKDKRTKRQKAIDRAIDEGYVPVPKLWKDYDNLEKRILKKNLYNE